MKSGRWEWFAFASRGGAIADVPLPLDIDVVPDSAPRVELVSPATDTLIVNGDRVALQITVSDDHGVASIDVVTSKDAGGRREPPVAQRVAANQGTLWNGTPMLDLASRELKAGDALRVQIVAIDNSPWAQ